MIKAYRKSVEKEPTVKKMSVNSRFKATKIIGQRKTFYRQRIPESSCSRKKTVCIDILVTSRNGDRKIMKSNRITSNNIYIYIHIYIYILHLATVQSIWP